MAGRLDRYKRAEKGSQLQTQIYVNRGRKALDEACLNALPSLATQHPSITWLSPLETDRFREYHDASFLKVIGRSELGVLLRRFWPGRGPHWDGLALVRTANGSEGVLLAEGKNYPGEMRASMEAKAQGSKDRIRRAIELTQNWLGVHPDKRKAWFGPHYQTANRLAHLYWFRQIVGVEAWVLHLLFTNDKKFHPTSESEWTKAMRQSEEEMGLDQIIVPHAGHALLPALDRELLLRTPAEAP